MKIQTKKIQKNSCKSDIYGLQILVNSLHQFLSPECKCNLQGSKNNNCSPESGKCECEDGYTGINCELSIGENNYCLLILE